MPAAPVMRSRAVLLLPLKGMERGFLMVQRPYEGSGLLAGLWELPGGCVEVQCVLVCRAGPTRCLLLKQDLTLCRYYEL